MVGSDDYGRDLTGVQNLRKKHKRIEAEISSHEPTIEVGGRVELYWRLIEVGGRRLVGGQQDYRCVCVKPYDHHAYILGFLLGF